MRRMSSYEIKNLYERYEIKYEYEGKQYTTIEQSEKGWEGQFLQKVLNRIESLTEAGAKIIGVVGYCQ